MNEQSIRVKNFFNSAFKEFSLYDNIRSINAIDGLKISQRKAIYGTLLRGENADELQIERLSSAISSCTDYHHGTASMASTLVGLAANKFPGSNNMNLFIPSGQFGSRLTKEPGAGRYIFTKLSPYFRQLFKKEDDDILEHNYVDGEKIEPKLYLPILPLVLLNGTTGMGTGHSCEIKSYHPIHIRDAVLKVLNGKQLVPGTLIPWFRGFHGDIQRNPENGQVIITGKLKIENSTTIRITELPVGTFLDQYKDHLNKLEEQDFIKDYEDFSSEDSFNFKITVPRAVSALSEEQLLSKFKLIYRDTENFTLWNSDGILERFTSPEAIIQMYVPWRLKFYEIRRQYLISQTQETLRFQSEIIRFIHFYIKNTKFFRDTSKKELIEVLLQNEFIDYERLLQMSIWNLTRDKIEELQKKLQDLSNKLILLEASSANEIYINELKEFKYNEELE